MRVLFRSIAGSATIAALNRGSAYYERLIQLNMERARVLPGPWTRHVIVDAVTARLWLYNSGKMQGTMRVVVGKPTEQTTKPAGMMRSEERAVGIECDSTVRSGWLPFHERKKIQR